MYFQPNIIANDTYLFPLHVNLGNNLEIKFESNEHIPKAMFYQTKKPKILN